MKLKTILGLFILFISLSFLIKYNSPIISEQINYIQCNDGNREVYNKSKLFICNGSQINIYQGELIKEDFYLNLNLSL